MLKRLGMVFSILSLMIWMAMADATISVSPIIINYTHGQRVEHVTVTNAGQHKAYVVVMPKRVENPGTVRQKEVIIHNPQNSGILVVPNQLIIPPGQKQDVQITMTKPAGKVDRIFRVLFKPEIAGLEKTAVPKNQKQIGIRLLVAYDTLVIQRPMQAKPKIHWARKGDELIMTNRGNTNVFINSVLLCNRHGKECHQGESKRLYAGNRWTLKLPYDKTRVTLNTRWDEHYHQLTKTL